MRIYAKIVCTQEQFREVMLFDENQLYTQHNTDKHNWI